MSRSFVPSRRLGAAAAAAALLVTTGAAAAVTATTAQAAEGCTSVGKRGNATAYGCPIWLPNDERRVPVYAQPGSNTEVDHLYRGGRANWFWCKASGPVSTDYGHRSSSWAKTMGDGGRIGWVPANYFAAKADTWTGLPNCGDSSTPQPPADPVPTDPPADPGEPSGPLDGPATAKVLLGRWGKQLGGDDAVRRDLQAAAEGRTINNSDTCGKTVTLDPRMLELLRQTTDVYTIQLSNIVTGHGCDTARHPKGKAYDVKRITKDGRSSNLIDGNGGNNPALNGEFAAWTAGRLPADNLSGLGQLGCSGRATIPHPPGVNVFADTCHHQHVHVGESDKPLPHQPKAPAPKPKPSAPAPKPTKQPTQAPAPKPAPSDAYKKYSKEQIDNARTIIAVGKGTGMPQRAYEIAIATAIQESQLKNLNYGDRDSLGLFQQRPGTGWGTPAQVTNPVLASKAFYGFADHTPNPGLKQIPGWENMRLTAAAQAVQRSGFPEAYQQWEGIAKEIVAQNSDVAPIN